MVYTNAAAPDSVSSGRRFIICNQPRQSLQRCKTFDGLVTGLAVLVVVVVLPLFVPLFAPTVEVLVRGFAVLPLFVPLFAPTVVLTVLIFADGA